MNVDLLVDAVDMSLHGMGRNDKLLLDRNRRVPFRQKQEHLRLTRRQIIAGCKPLATVHPGSRMVFSSFRFRTRIQILVHFLMLDERRVVVPEKERLNIDEQQHNDAEEDAGLQVPFERWTEYRRSRDKAEKQPDDVAEPAEGHVRKGLDSWMCMYSATAAQQMTS